MASTLMISTTEDKHDHIVYLYDEVKFLKDEKLPIIGYTSLDGNHRHDVALLPETPPSQDPETGKTIEGTQEQVMLMPSKDEHYHTIEGPLTVEYKSRYDESEEDRLSRYKDMVRDAEEADKQYIEQAKECEDFYFGGEGQWPEESLKTLKSQKRPRISLNYTASMVNCVTGYQFQNGTYPIPVPTEDGDQVVADMLRGLNYHYLEKNKFKFIRKDVCKDQCITGRGAYLIRIKTDLNLEKHIIIEKIDWQDVLFTQHDKNTGEDSRAAIFSRWVNVQDLKGVVDKEKYDKIYSGDSYEQKGSTFYDKENKRVRQCMVLHREVKERDVLINTLEKDKAYVLDGNDGRIHGGFIDKSIQDRILSINGFAKIKRKTPEIWESLFTADVIISDEVSHFSDFNLIPAYAIKRKQNVKGIINDLRDPTRVVNKAASLELEYMTRVLNNPMLYDDETFGGDEALANKFFQNAKTPGAGLKVADTLKPPVQIQPSPMPPEIPAIRERMNIAQREISGINPELMGGGSEAGSNLLYLQKKNSALLCNEDIFAGLDLADKSLALRLIDVYKKVLTPEKVYRILKNSNSRMSNVGGLEVGGQEFDKYSKDDIMDLWARSDLSKYDIAIGDGQETPTKRAADTAMMVEMIKQGANIPMDMIVGRIIDDPNIRKQQQGMTQRQQEITQQLEEKKLSIAENQQLIAAEASKLKAQTDDKTKREIAGMKAQLDEMKIMLDAQDKDMKNQIEIAKLDDSENTSRQA